MFLPLLAALAIAPAEEELTILVTEKTLDYSGPVTIELSSEDGKSQELEITLESGKGKVELAPLGEDPHVVEVIDDRFERTKVKVFGSTLAALELTGKGTVKVNLVDLNGHPVYQGSLVWVQNGKRVPLRDGVLSPNLEYAGFIDNEGAHLDIAPLGGIPFTVDVPPLSFSGVTTIQARVPPHTLTLRLLDAAGVPLSNVACTSEPEIVLGGSKVRKKSDGHGLVSFEGVTGRRTVFVYFSDHIIVRETVDLDPSGRTEAQLTCPPSGEVLINVSEEASALAPELAIRVQGKGPKYVNTSWVPLAELTGVLRVPAGEVIIDVTYRTGPHTGMELRDTIEVEPGARVTYPFEVDRLPARLLFKVTVDGKTFEDFSLRRKGPSGLKSSRNGHEEQLLDPGTYTFTLRPHRGRWKKEVELTLLPGSHTTHTVEVSSDE